MIRGLAASKESSEISNNNTPKNCNEIGAYDVLCGRNKASFNNVGNRRFRVLVSNSLHEYVNVATRRKEKSQVVRNIISTTIESGGRFLQEKDGALVELSDRDAQVKVGHAIRDMVLAKTKTNSDEFSVNSSTSNKVKGSVINALPKAQDQDIPCHSSIASERLESRFCDSESYEPIPLESIVSESCNNCITRALQILSTDDNKSLQRLSTDDDNVEHTTAQNFHVSGLEELVDVEYENLEDTISPEIYELLLEHFTY